MIKTTPSDFRLQTSFTLKIFFKNYSFFVIELFLASGHSLIQISSKISSVATE